MDDGGGDDNDDYDDNVEGYFRPNHKHTKIFIKHCSH